MSQKENISFNNAIEAINYAIEILETVLDKSGNGLDREYVLIYSLKQYLPYSIDYTSVEGIYIITNVNYRPLGIFQKKWCDYDKYPSLHIKLTDEELLKVTKEDSMNHLWVYPHTPMNSVSEAYEYLTRLKRLLNILESKK